MVTALTAVTHSVGDFFVSPTVCACITHALHNATPEAVPDAYPVLYPMQTFAFLKSLHPAVAPSATCTAHTGSGTLQQPIVRTGLE